MREENLLDKEAEPWLKVDGAAHPEVGRGQLQWEGEPLLGAAEKMKKKKIKKKE